MGKERVSGWGGREHFITALAAGRSSGAVCTYLVVWVRGVCGTGEEEAEVVSGDGGGESSRERLAIVGRERCGRIYLLNPSISISVFRSSTIDTRHVSKTKVRMWTPTHLGKSDIVGVCVLLATGKVMPSAWQFGKSPHVKPHLLCSFIHGTTHHQTNRRSVCAFLFVFLKHPCVSFFIH